MSATTDIGQFDPQLQEANALLIAQVRTLDAQIRTLDAQIAAQPVTIAALLVELNTANLAANAAQQAYDDNVAYQIKALEQAQEAIASGDMGKLQKAFDFSSAAFNEKAKLLKIEKAEEFEATAAQLRVEAAQLKQQAL